MIPWKFQHIPYIYGSFWKMNPGKYDYKILFFEKEGHAYSCKDKFPVTLSDGSVFTKEQFVKIVEEAFSPLNALNIGVSFSCIGQDTTDNENIAFDMKDGINTITYFWSYKWGGLSAPMSRDGFGIKANLHDKARREWYIGVIRHELTHCLGFTHKDVFLNTKAFRESPVIAGLNGRGELTEDTIHGFKTVYGIDTKFKISGVIKENSYLERAEAFLVDWKTKKPTYQSPIDLNKQFKFSFDKKIDRYKVFLLGKEKETGYYRFNILWDKPKKMDRLNRQLELKEADMVNCAVKLEDVQSVTKIKLI